MLLEAWAEIFTKKVPFWGDLKTPKFPSETNWPLKPHLDFRSNVEDTLECMRDKRVEDITLLEYYVDNYSLNFFPFVVTIDETFLPMSPRTLLEKKAFKDISVLIGSNANEGKITY